MTESENRLYERDDGTTVPLFEADYDMEFTVYRKDGRYAIIGDPKNCIEAKGLCRMDGVIEAYVGSGKDAYVVFSSTRSRPYPHAIHFIIRTKSARVRDTFEVNKSIRTQLLTLSRPTDGETLSYRNNLDKQRRIKIKKGEHIPVRRDKNKPRITRFKRLSVPCRPRAKIRKNKEKVSVVSVG